MPHRTSCGIGRLAGIGIAANGALKDVNRGLTACASSGTSLAQTLPDPDEQEAESGHCEGGRGGPGPTKLVEA